MRRKICKLLAVHGTNRGASNCDKQEVSLEEVEKVFHMLSLR